MLIEKSYLEMLLTSLRFSAKKSFVQIASVAGKGDACVPSLRTVLLLCSSDQRFFYFTTSCNAKKWTEIALTPVVSGLYFDPINTKQFRFEAKATLISADASDEEDSKFYREQWHFLNSGVRHAIWQEYLNDSSKQYDIEEICPIFGVIRLYPYYWDIFKLDARDFMNSKRTQMRLDGDVWHVADNTPIIHPLPFDEIVS